MKKIKLAISIIFVIFVVSSATLGWSDEDATYRRPAYVPGEILVKFKDSVVREQKNRFHQNMRAIKLREHRHLKLQRVKLPNDLSVTEALEIYKQNPDVEYAEPNYIIKATNTPNDPLFVDLWGLNNIGQTGGSVDSDINAPEAWDIHTGDGNVIIAIIDTGIDYTHEDLIANIWSNDDEMIGDGNSDGCSGLCGVDEDGDGLVDEDPAGRFPGDGGYNPGDDDENGYIDDIRGWNFVSNNNDPMDDDVDGHGTHVAGIVGAVGNNSVGVSGVNWSIKLMPLKFLDSSGSGTAWDAIDAITYAVENSAKVINASYGYPENCAQVTPLLPEKNAIEAAGNAGVLFVAAAGNDGCDNDDTFFYPASHDLPNIISVAATDDDDELASFSNFGVNSVDLGAPGVSILSTVPANRYAYLNGTSMATPYVSGVAGLILSYRGYTYPQVKEVLLSSVDTPPTSLTGKVLTNGRLNARTALDSDINAIPPFKPSDLKFTDVSGSEINLSWVDNSSIEDGFEVGRWDEASGIFTVIAYNLPSNTTSYMDAPPVPEGVAYKYRIRAFNAVGYSSYSNEASVTPFNAPSSLSAIVGSASQIDLSWTDNSSAEDGYKVERKTGMGTFTQIDTVGADTTVYSDSGLSSGTSYTYRVRAYNASGDSNYSNEASATTLSSSGGGGNVAGAGGGGGGGCFIATAAFGSYLDPHVEVLREFRDKWLLKDMRLEVGSWRLEIHNVLGEAFVDFYYKVSPPIAAYISRHETLRVITRWALTPLVYGMMYPVVAFFLVCLGTILFVKSRHCKRSNA